MGSRSMNRANTNSVIASVSAFSRERSVAGSNHVSLSVIASRSEAIPQTAKMRLLRRPDRLASSQRQKTPSSQRQKGVAH